MNSKIVLIFMISFLSMFMIGCSVSEVVCNSPYIKVGTICCLDQNNNSICDSDESTKILDDNQIKSIEDTNLNESDYKGEIISYKISLNEGSSEKYDQYKIIGEIQNNDRTISLPKINFIGYDMNNDIVCSEYTFAEFDKLVKGETSPFKLNIYLSDCKNLNKYKLKFEDYEIKGSIDDIEIIEDEIEEESIDKCEDISDVTVEGTEELRTVCYTSKYLDYSIIMDNISICNEINKEDWLGYCYGNFAFKNDNLELCNKTPVKKYVARGFYEEISSRDVCYNYYLQKLGDELYYSYEDVDIPEKLCEYIENNQMKELCFEYYNKLN